jgi:hypothetical protein
MGLRFTRHICAGLEILKIADKQNEKGNRYLVIYTMVLSGREWSHNCKSVSIHLKINC